MNLDRHKHTRFERNAMSPAANDDDDDDDVVDDYVDDEPREPFLTLPVVRVDVLVIRLTHTPQRAAVPSLTRTTSEVVYRRVSGKSVMCWLRLFSFSLDEIGSPSSQTPTESVA